MSTSVLFMEGVSDDGGKTITYNTSENNPMTGEDEPVRFVFRWVDNDTHILESWHGAGTPNEFKVMEITCTRKK
ncbi:MAG: DUF1579 family protein [bacterium]|nr:DUF1579 family protein [bacterium]